MIRICLLVARIFLKPHGMNLKVFEEAICQKRRYASGLCILWYPAAIFTGLMLSARSMDSGHLMRPTETNKVFDMFRARGIVVPTPGTDYSARHISGTKLFGAAVVQFRSHCDCFSKSGNWIYNATPRYIVPNAFSDYYDMQCELNENPGAVGGDEANQIAANGDATEWIVREEVKWEWQSDEVLCPLLLFNREHFCRLIGPRNNMMVVGDSLNQQLFWILLNHLVVNRTGWPQPPTQVWKWRSFGLHEVCEDVLGGPGQGFNISFVRNDRLSLILRQADDGARNFHELLWIHLVLDWNISVLLLNRGAHFEDDVDVTEALTNMFSVISNRWPNTRVFYRNTPPGHINCTQHQEPMKERESHQTLSQYNSNTFHWADFQRQNEITRHITHQFGHTFIDLDSVMALRPDGHPKSTDCLHYCLPGPLDVFAKLFYNTLGLLEM